MHNEIPTTKTKTSGRVRLAALTIAALSALWVLIGAASADASTYNVRQCWSQGGHGIGAGTYSETGTNFEQRDFCNNAAVPWATIRANNGGNGHLQGGEWRWTAPPGTYFDQTSIEYGISPGSGYGGFVFRANAGSHTPVFWEAKAGPSNQVSTTADLQLVGLSFYCGAGGGCIGDTFPYGRIRDVRMNVVDTSGPSAPAVGGSIFEPGWKKGTSESIGASFSDIGAGVDRLTIEVNGQTSTLKDMCNPASTAGWIASLTPCPTTGGHIGLISTTSGGFEDGANNVQVCGAEYGAGAAVSCTNRTVSVDNNAPSKPTDLAVAQGSDWQQSDSFDLSWSNPGGQAAPIDGAYLRVQGPGGYDTGQVFEAGANKSSAQVTVPEPGEYTVEISLRDQAGQVNHANNASATLRFDDVPPEESLPEIANGWLGKAELGDGYLQGWEPPDTPHPVSGIKGYAFVADQSQGTDPCDVAGAGDAATECSDGEVNHQGIENRSASLGSNDLEEGDNYVHVVPVSGARVKANEIEETKLQVDTGDPKASIQGVPNGWSRSAVSLTTTGSDSLSGMVDNDLYPNDDPPATFLQIDGSSANEPDASITRSVSGDGNHTITYWARDLAGNTAAKQTAQVRIDRTAPVAYLEKADPQDPEQIRAAVSDPTSGLASAKLQVKENSGAWKNLPSKLASGKVSAAMDSAKMSDGVTYRFRVVATDVAGNTAQVSTYANGGEAVQVGPFRDGSRIVGLTLNGKEKGSKVPYGTKSEVKGKLVDEDGIPLGGASVVIIEDYDAGSKFGAVRSKVKTNSAGQFTKTLRKGPGRSVSASFEGDRQLLASNSRTQLRLRVKGKAKLAVKPKRVGAGKKTQFRGRIGRRGAKLGKRGKLVEIQVRVGKKWKTLDKPLRTNSKGRYKLRYRFGRFYERPTTFKVRAKMLKESGFPYRPAKSKIKKVTVVP